MGNRNIDILEHIVRYCDEIDEARKRFGNSMEALLADSIYRNAVAMCILQIGELAANLSDEFKVEHNKAPWQKIKGMRNIAAHHYGKFDVEIMFNTIEERIPELRDYCLSIVADNK